MSPKIAISDSVNEIALIRIKLRDTNPQIWREVEVPTSITLKVMHILGGIGGMVIGIAAALNLNTVGTAALSR